MPAEYGDSLSPRQLEIVALVAEGLTNREIAARAYLSPNTVKVHLRNIFAKTGVASRTELTVLAMQQGWVHVPGIQVEEEAADAEDVADAEESADAVEIMPEDSAADTVAAESVEQAAPVVDATFNPPPWPRERGWGLALGFALAVVILFLPQRPRDPAAASSDGNIFDPRQAPLEPLPLTEDDGWEELSPLPVRCAGLGLAVGAGRVYGVGGITVAGPVADLSIYDLVTGEWHAAAPRPVALANVGAGLVGPYLLVPGGCDVAWQPQAVSHIYDTQQAVWLDVAPLPMPLCAYALATFQDEVYVLGGLDNAGDYRAVTYIYNFVDDAWRMVTPPTEARAFGAAAAIGDRIFYVGGHDGRRERGTCEVYIPAQDRWQSCAPMLQPRSGLGLTALSGRLQAIGGGWDVYLGFNERYNPERDQWTVLETPIIGEWRNLGVAAWDGALYAVGGWNGDYMNRMYKFELLRHRIFITTMFAGGDGGE